LVRLVLVLISGFCLITPARSQDFHIDIPRVRTTVPAGATPAPITVWGSLSRSSGGPVRLSMTADLRDLQTVITAVLRDRLNRSDRCGERLSIASATLVPAAPAAGLNVNLHYERWGCAKIMGKEMTKRLVGGDGSVSVLVRPTLDGDALAFAAEVQKIEADGSLGELLRAGSLGDSVREKIAGSIQSALEKALDPKTILPPAAATAVVLRRAQFIEGSEGQLLLSLEAEIRISPDQLQSLARQIQSR
jgi:hypothetical protein